MGRLLSIAPLLAVLFAPGAARAEAGWSWPVEGEVITPYRNGADPYAGGQHRGIDIAVAAGTPVRAAARGTVTFSGTAGSSGLTVAMRTADGRFDTSYLHLSALSVREGDRVEAGARLGAVGTSGRRSAVQPHLHFGVRDAGSRHAYRDPLTLLPPAPTPVRQAPRGVPVSVPAPVRAAPRRERVPRAAPVRRRAPAGRRIRVPAPSPRGAPARPTLAPRPVTPVKAPRRFRSRAPGREPAPRLGPQPRSLPAQRPERTPRLERDAAPEAKPAGPDLGMGLACLGLLAAAACLGTRGSGKAAERPFRALLGPLLGRR